MPPYASRKRQRAGGGGLADWGFTRRYSRVSGTMGPFQKRRYAKIRGLGIKKEVRDQILALAEKKQCNGDPRSFAFNANNTTMSGPDDLVSNYLDVIGQGAGNGQRVGNKIYIHEYTIRMNFQMNPTYVSSATFRPGIVQVWIGRLKDSPGVTPSATDLTRIYDDGNGTAGVDGTMLATMRSLNRDYFDIVAYKKFKLGSSGAQAAGGVPLYPNNDFPIQYNCTIKNLLKGEVKFNDTFPQGNKYLFMWYTFTTVDSVPLTVSVPVIGEYYVECKYSDI